MLVLDLCQKLYTLCIFIFSGDRPSHSETPGSPLAPQSGGARTALLPVRHGQTYVRHGVYGVLCPSSASCVIRTWLYARSPLHCSWICCGFVMLRHWEGCEVLWYTCLPVCLCPLEQIEYRTVKLHQNFAHVAYGCGSILLWRHCDTSYTSGFVDDS